MTVALRSSVISSPSWLDRGFAGPHVASRLTLGGRGGHQQLLGGDLLENPLQRRVALGMADDAGHLDLVHCENQRRRRTGLTENEADVGEFGDRRAFAAQRGGHHDAEQPLLADLGESLRREARGRIDRGRMLCGRLGGNPRARGVSAGAGAQNLGAGGRNSLGFHRFSIDRWVKASKVPHYESHPPEPTGRLTEKFRVGDIVR